MRDTHLWVFGGEESGAITQNVSFHNARVFQNLLCVLLYVQYPVQCLAHIRCSINIFGINALSRFCDLMFLLTSILQRHMLQQQNILFHLPLSLSLFLSLSLSLSHTHTHTHIPSCHNRNCTVALFVWNPESPFCLFDRKTYSLKRIIIIMIS